MFIRVSLFSLLHLNDCLSLLTLSFPSLLPAFTFLLVPSSYIGVDNNIALHMAVLANWAKAWRQAGGQENSLPVHDEGTCHTSALFLSCSCVIPRSSFSTYPCFTRSLHCLFVGFFFYNINDQLIQLWPFISHFPSRLICHSIPNSIPLFQIFRNEDKTTVKFKSKFIFRCILFKLQKFVIYIYLKLCCCSCHQAHPHLTSYFNFCHRIFILTLRFSIWY